MNPIKLNTHPDREGRGHSGAKVAEFCYDGFRMSICHCTNNSYHNNDKLYVVDVSMQQSMPYIIGAKVYQDTAFYEYLLGMIKEKKDLLSRVARGQCLLNDYVEVEEIFYTTMEFLFLLMNERQKISMFKDVFQRGIIQGKKDKAREIRAAFEITDY